MKKLFASKIGLISITLLLGVILGWMFHSLSSSSAESHDHESSEGVPTLWTCSMDPQVKLNAPGDCPICGMDLIPVTQGTEETSNPQAIQMTKEALAMAAVQTQVVADQLQARNSSFQVNCKRMNAKMLPFQPNSLGGLRNCLSPSPGSKSRPVKN